jgi:uncharacterized protein YecT (DUF1311 family)
MPTDAFTPDLSKLDKNYQVLTELGAEAASRTYLARHLRLNRDVTITVTWLVGDDNNALTHFAADAHLLMATRHPNVVPVIEGIWLDERTFAIVRARVRGTTLEQMIASGPLPMPRVSTTIQQLESALSWARGCGVVHRSVTPRSIVFQQGNGRAFVSFEPRPLAADAMPGECDDARTIAQLASEMLTGQTDDNGDRSAKIVVPPRIVPDVAEALEAVRRCDRTSATATVAALIAALAPKPDSDAEVERPPVVVDAPVSVPAAPPNVPTNVPAKVPANVVEVESVFDSVPRIVVPPRGVRRHARAREAVVPVRQSFGFNARLGSAIAVSTILGVLSVFLYRHREPSTPAIAASQVAADTTQQAAGDIATRPSRLDSIAAAAAARPPQPPPQLVAAIPRDTINRERPKTELSPVVPVIRDSMSVPERTPARDSSTSTQGAESCASPEFDDQRKCLMAAIERNDRELKTVFAKLVAALRLQASVAASDPDPETVDQLRAAQRKWLEERDSACRDVGERPLFARERSSCFAQQSADRVRELQKMLDAIPPD